VSVHVPAYNEPPEMMIETLNALAALDYPDFEVIVIDNNTKDRRCGNRCASMRQTRSAIPLLPRRSTAGFKAGALNFALRQTDTNAEIVAVIDSDYIVHPRWLRDLVPQFANERIGIVQHRRITAMRARTLQGDVLCRVPGFFYIAWSPATSATPSSSTAP